MKTREDLLLPRNKRDDNELKSSSKILYNNMFLRTSLLIVLLTCLSLLRRTSPVRISREMVGMPGGFYAVDGEDLRVKTAAQFAVQELATSPYPQLLASSASSGSLKIVEAAQQVVAGMNYRLKIQILNSQQQCVGMFSVTVYDRFGDLSVTEWGESNIPCPPEPATNISLGKPDVAEEDPDDK